MASLKCAWLNSWKLWHLNLHSLRNFTSVIKLKILKWEDYFRLTVWMNVNTKDFVRGDRRVRIRERCMMMEAGFGVSWLQAKSLAASSCWER
jgi:hypothetical protein